MRISRSRERGEVGAEGGVPGGWDGKGMAAGRGRGGWCAGS